jgi:hypothetical protein
MLMSAGFVLVWDPTGRREWPSAETRGKSFSVEESSTLGYPNLHQPIQPDSFSARSLLLSPPTPSTTLLSPVDCRVLASSSPARSSPTFRPTRSALFALSPLLLPHPRLRYGNQEVVLWDLPFSSASCAQPASTSEPRRQVEAVNVDAVDVVPPLGPRLPPPRRKTVPGHPPFAWIVRRRPRSLGSAGWVRVVQVVSSDQSWRAGL